jgi:hypothetical protein
VTLAMHSFLKVAGGFAEELVCGAGPANPQCRGSIGIATRVRHQGKPLDAARKEFV